MGLPRWGRLLRQGEARRRAAYWDNKERLG